VDLLVTTPGGQSEFHQCKRSNRQVGKWSLNELRARSVLATISERLKSDRQARFHLVSRDAAPDLRDLAESARDSLDPDSFYRDQIRASGQRQRAFKEFCSALDLTPGRPSELAEARDLLQRTHSIQVEDNDPALRELQALARPYIDGTPPLVISALESWAQRTLRRVISAAAVEAFLRSQGFYPRMLARDDRILPAISRLQDRFETTLGAELVQGRLLARQEADQLVELLRKEDGPRFIAVHGPAGVGKSGVLLDLAGRLKSQGVPYLPLRLDRQRPDVTTRQFGERLDLPESPAYCLDAVSGGKEAVLLLDQLDALRWTGAKAAQALDTCRQMVKEALTSANVRVVACCRTFDLENDPQIRSWIEGDQARKLPLGRLSEKTVREVVSATGVDPASLTGRQLDLLRTIQLLRTWEQTVGTSQRGPAFATERELLDAFWESRVEEASRTGVDPTTLQLSIDKVVTYLDENGVLTAPRRLFHGRPAVKKVLLSLNVLSEDANGIQFCHQTYLDHQLAHLLMRRIDEGETDVEGWLTGSHQDLRRREQLRLVLGLLREERIDRYLATVRALVESPSIRLHLKQLVLQFLGQVEEPCSEETDFVIALLQKPEWQEHAIADVVQGHPAWFRAAVEAGFIQTWLDGTDRERDRALLLVRSVAEQEGDLCHRLLSPLVDRGGDWIHRVAAALPRAPAEDSDSLFDLRVRLTKQGVDRPFLDWKGLGGKDLHRLVLLLRLLLPRMSADPAHVDRDDSSLLGIGDVDLGHNPIDELVKAWAVVIPLASQAMKFHAAAGAAPFLEHEHGWRIRLRVVLRRLAAELMERAPKAIMEGVDERPDTLADLLTLEVLPEVKDATVADRALDWLVWEPSRLRLRWCETDLPWEASGRALGHLTQLCSSAAYSAFEGFLLDFREPRLRQSMEDRHERLLPPPGHQPRFAEWALRYPSTAGETAYHLLPCLPEYRISAVAQRRLMELRRRFASVDEVFFGCFRSHAGSVGSPISSDRLSLLSDKTWIEILGRNSTSRPGARWRRSSRDGSFEEASPRTFATDLETATAKEPGRFARLALRFPPDANPLYFSAVLRGLRVPQVSHEPPLSKSVAWLIGSRPELDWSASTVDLLTIIATAHHEPADGELILRGGPEEWGPENLVTNALNCARGVATLAVSNLLFHDPSRVERLGEVVERVARDPHPAVRVAVFDCCLAMLEQEPERAMALALRALEGHEALFACSHFDRFLRFAARRHPEEMEPTLRRMLRSDREDVVQLGASHTVALYLFLRRMEEVVLDCVHGTEPQRLGAARVAGALADSADHQAGALRILAELLKDESDQVLRACTDAFHGIHLDAFEQAGQFLEVYAASRAFKCYPTVLLHRLRSHSGDIRPFAACILTVCESLAERREHAPDETQSMSWEAGYYLPPILLRLYEQAPNGSRLRKRCLDAWDRLLEARVLSAMDLTKSLDADSVARNQP
jgi:hypothetical protein